MNSSSSFRLQAKRETSKRLLAQLVNDGLLNLELIDSSSPRKWRGINPRLKDSDTSCWLEVTTVPCINATTLLNCPVWRPNDFLVPVLLCTAASQIEEDEPGSIFEFVSPWFTYGEDTKEVLVHEVRSSVDMGGLCISPGPA
jgi:hypothetical protein